MRGRGVSCAYVVLALVVCPPRAVSGEPGLLTSQTPEQYFQLALKSYLIENYLEALRLLRECLTQDPTHPQAKKLLPLVLKRQDEDVRAQATKTNSLLGEERFRAGISLYIAGNLTAAAEQLENALALAPTHERARELLQNIQAQTRPHEAAAPPLLPPEKAAQRISLSVRDAPIAEVLENLSQLYQLNIVASEEVSGTTTVSFVDVTLEEASVDLGAAGMSCELGHPRGSAVLQQAVSRHGLVA